VGPRSRSTERTIDYEVSITQPIEIAGRRRARIDATAAAAKAAEARLAEWRGAVAADVREAFGRALAAEAHEQLATDAIQLATQALTAAEKRYQTGAASLIEVNTARIEVGRSQRARGAAKRMRAAALAELKLLLGMGPAAQISLEGQLQPSPQGHALDLRALTSLAAQNRADLLAARHELEAARAEQRLATREAVPTPRVGVSFSKEEDAQVVQGVLSMELPFFNRNQAARGVSSARVQQAELAIAALEQRVAQEVELSVDRVRTAREILDGFSGDVLKALDENIALVTRGYEVGELDFLELLLMRRDMLEARREYIEALAELNSAEAQLDRVLGVRLGTPGSGHLPATAR
jgi:cobalt-zinc-cadmium efflux system outer membrane protein